VPPAFGAADFRKFVVEIVRPDEFVVVIDGEIACLPMLASVTFTGRYAL